MARFLKSALNYIGKNWFVFPLYEIVDGKCSCGEECASPGKHPRIKSGLIDATIDEKLVREWGTKWPDANIGISTGQSGLYVIDVDAKSEGLESIKEYLEFVPEMSKTLVAATGGGGNHYYFRMPENPLKSTQGVLGKGIDTRGIGGYVLAPPSNHKSGNKYNWSNVVQLNELPTLPNYIISKLEEPRGKGSVTLTEDGQIPPGERHSYFISMAASMRNRQMNESTMLAAMRSVNQELCDPLHDDSDLVSIARSYAGMASYQIKEHSKQVEGKKKLSFKSATKIKPVETQWLLPGYFAISKLNLLWGMEGFGKSFCSIGMAAMLSRGEPLPGLPQNGELGYNGKPYRSVLINFEDSPEDTIVPRLIRCGADLSMIDVYHFEDGLITSADVEALSTTLGEIPDLRLVVIDPVTSYAAGISDNDETAVRTVVDPLIRMAASHQFALIAVKHANKRNEASVRDRTSGARAWTGASRSVVLAGHDSDKVQEKYRTYGGMIPTKGNLSGQFQPLSFQIIDGRFEFTGIDPTLTAERLFPAKTQEKEKK